MNAIEEIMARQAQFRWTHAAVGILAIASLTTLPRMVAGEQAFLAAVEVPSAPGAPKPSDHSNSVGAFAGKLPITELNEQEAILHALNRLGYGPRPSEVEQIQKTGLEKWIRAQLHPEGIDDSRMEARIAEYPALQMTAAQLLEAYPQPEVAAKRLNLTVEQYRQRVKDLAKQKPGSIAALPYKDSNEIVNTLMEVKLLRAAYSERPLAEQLDDFWFNHFNVFIYKDLVRWYAIPYERDAIRPRVLGKFRDLLEATAKSPAMLFYLDNSSSADPRAFERLKQRPPHASRQPSGKLPPTGSRRGLNENYGRELMELHTLGVGGGYSQQDVINVARSFTGWTIRSPREVPEFYFDERLHDPNPKRVLGKNIHSGGIKDGEHVLDLLSKDRHTAHHISLELAQHFISDEPPEALVARMAKTYEKSKGDIRAVMTTMIYAPEFWSRAAFRSKVKTPFELVASTIRALGANVEKAQPVTQWVARIGEPLYQCQTPNGYSDKAASWVSTGSLLNRMNFAIALSNNKVQGAHVELKPLIGSDNPGEPVAALDRAESMFLGGQVSDSTRKTLAKETSNPGILGAKLDDPVRQVNFALITGLVLGSPEFQKR